MNIKFKTISDLESFAENLLKVATTSFPSKLSEQDCQEISARMAGYESWEDANKKIDSPKILQEDKAVMQAYKSHMIAEQFITASGRAKNTQCNGDFFQSAPIPAVVMMAFAIELSFKSICLSENRYSKSGHDLSFLFKNLSDDAQNEIETAAPAPTYPKYKTERTFKNSLKKVSSAFNDWRYVHEGSNLLIADLDFLSLVAAAAQKKAKALIPAHLFAISMENNSTNPS